METTKESAREIALRNISKDILQEYYCNHTREDVCKHFNITMSTLQWLLKFYNIKKTKEQKRITISETYGEKFYKDRKLKTDQSKINKYGSIDRFEKFRREKTEEGLIKKYGSIENYIEHMKQSLKNTMLEKYGVENASQLDFVKDKKKESMINNYGSLEEAYHQRNLHSAKTLIERTGYDHNFKDPSVKEKREQTWLSTIGCYNPFASQEIQQKIKNTMLEKYGVPYALMLPQCMSNGVKNSKPNLKFEKLLIDNSISYEREFPLGNYIYDFKIGQLLIEINPSATHNSTWSPFGNHIGISKYYHQQKSKNAFNYGYRCVNVFDWISYDSVICNIKENKYEIEQQDFIEPRLIIYNMKEKKINEFMSDECVEVYDDGIVINNGGL